LQPKRFRFVLQFGFPPPPQRPRFPNQRRRLAAIVLVFVVGLSTTGFFAFSRAATAVQRTTTAMAKNPLRLIVSRFPRYEVLYDDPEHEKLTGWVDTLECGHQVDLYNFGLAGPSLGPEGGQKRHRCAECAALQQVAPKKPAQSVTVDSNGNQDLKAIAKTA
jgi:hypothetical protein